ncbi:MAG: HEAT repeat domain-containing protein [Planctomycetes bacterium]|nr:HEAT repeat domain-containing protein [Planctomycetota bacterium]
MSIPLRLAVCLVFVSCGAVAAIQTGQPTPSDDLAKAIAEMRNLPQKLEGAEAAERGPRIQKAWDTLIAAKDAGAEALLAEARQLAANGERDDRFRLGAGAVVWRIGGLARVDDILTLWADADFSVKYSYAFQVAGQAMTSKDPRALPLLVALLRDQRGEYTLAQHAMTIGWPATHLMLWAPLGLAATPTLSKLLAAPPDPTTAASCAHLLASFYDEAALPQLRTLAREGHGPVRFEALRSVGRFGHPDDQEWLFAGLASEDAELATAHLSAVAAFGDLRAVPHVLERLKDADERVRMTALRALVALPTCEGLDAVLAWCRTYDGPEQEHHDEIVYRVSLLFGDLDAAESYEKLPVEERRLRITQLRLRQGEQLRVPQGDRQLTRGELRELCTATAELGRVPEPFEWVQARHLLAAATAADLALLIDARGGLYRRFSDEQIEAIEQFERALLWLARAQYRVDPGVSEQVQRRS